MNIFQKTENKVQSKNHLRRMKCCEDRMGAEEARLNPEVYKTCK